MTESTKHRIYLSIALALYLIASNLDFMWSAP